MEQRVVCAAIRHKDGDIICSPRHFDRRMGYQIINNKFSGWTISEQGFVDQQGKFLTRKEALVIAKRSNQIIRRCGGDEEKLYSENLY